MRILRAHLLAFSCSLLFNCYETPRLSRRSILFLSNLSLEADIPQFDVRVDKSFDFLWKEKETLLQNSSTISRATLFAMTIKHRIVRHINGRTRRFSSKSTPSFRLLDYTRVWSSVIHRPDTCRRPTGQKQRASSSSRVGTWRKKRKKKKKKKSRISVNVNRRHSFISSGPIIEGWLFPLEITPPREVPQTAVYFGRRFRKSRFDFSTF